MKRWKFLIVFIFMILIVGLFFVFKNVLFLDEKSTKEVPTGSEPVLSKVYSSLNAGLDVDFGKIDCLKKKFPEDNFSGELKKLKSSIVGMYGRDTNVMYEDLTDGYVISNGMNESWYAASVNKLPLAIYAYKLADEGKLDLNKKLTYTSHYKKGGAGVVKDSSYGTSYTIAKLLEYTMQFSDNSAYVMLTDEIGLSNVKSYFKNLGYNIPYSDKFGNLSAYGGSVYIKEVYNYYLSGSENALKLVSDMKKSRDMDTIKDTDSYEVAHKYGSHNQYYNDASLVFSNYPYSLTIMSLMGDTDSKDKFFLKSHKLFYEFNEKYWDEKSNYCLG